jgi:hypothetical protein
MDAPRQCYESSSYDREVTLKALKASGHLAVLDVCGEEERVGMRERADGLVEKAMGLLPGDAQGANAALKEALALRAEAVRKALRLTPAGQALARRILEAGFTYDRLRYTTD